MLAWLGCQYKPQRQSFENVDTILLKTNKSQYKFSDHLMTHFDG